MKPLNYRVSGNGPNTIVWVHGYCGDLNIWDKSVSEFQDYNNITFDYYGHGNSPKDIAPELAIEKTIESAKEIVSKESSGNII